MDGYGASANPVEVWASVSTDVCDQYANNAVVVVSVNTAM
jgi:hypothetical protein